MSEQMTFKRYEVKYKITRSQMSKLLEGMKEYMIADEHGRSTIQSLYFDTPNFHLVRSSMDKPMYKEKLRLRSYGVAGKDSTVFVELKKKYDGIVYKRRTAMKLQDAEGYLTGGKEGVDSQVGREIDYFLGLYKGIRPAMMLSYEREAFYARDDHEFRITFDDNVMYRTEDLTMDAGIYGTKLLDDDTILMEVKVAEAIPMWFVKLLSENKIYKSSFSKYGTAYSRIAKDLQLADPAYLRKGNSAAAENEGKIYPAFMAGLRHQA